ncbi:unnamed protein product, partial [Brassica rapa]
VVFECKVGFENGDVVKVTIQYEDLYRYCYSCKRISHEEGTCPELNDNQRERHRLARIDQKDKEDRATKEAFSQPQRSPRDYTDIYNRESRGRELRSTYQEAPEPRRDGRREEERYNDLRKHLKERRDAHSKNVWKRLEPGNHSELPRDRERYHPYQHSSGALSKGRTRDAASSSEWRPKRVQESRYEQQPTKHRDQGFMGSRSRMSMDSQRTISENPKRFGAISSGRGRNSRSPPSGVLEWRPVNRDRVTEKPRGLLKKNTLSTNFKDTPEEEARADLIRRRSNSTDHDLGKGSQSIHGMEAVSTERTQVEGANITAGKAPLSNDLDQVMHLEEDPEKGQETEKDREEQELEKSIADFADQAMTEDMINEDDLLADIAEMEKQTQAEDKEDGRIEAISQLSPQRPNSKTAEEAAPIDKQIKKRVQEEKFQDNSLKNQRNHQESQQITTLGKKRGARSPDLKGVAASRKLATRGRLSPKPKTMKTAREISYDSRKGP